MHGYRSLGVKLKRAKTYQGQHRTLSEWSKSWQADQENTLDALKAAVKRGDVGEALHMADRLNGITAKRFTALNNMINLISDPKRVLIDLEDKPAQAPEPTPEQEHIPEPVKAPPEVRTKNAASLEIDEIVRRYNQGTSIQAIADTGGISSAKVIKILVTEGVYTSEVYDRIKELRLEGKSDDEIAKICSLGRSVMDRYTPYRKGVYKSDNPTDNALRVRKSREKS